MRIIAAGTTLETLRVIIEAQTRSYRQEMERVRQTTSQATAHVDRQTQKMSGMWKKVGTAVKMALGVVGVRAIFNFGQSCVKLGSDLAEVQNVVDVTFGGMSGAVDKFAKDAIGKFGLSETMAKKYMGTYGAMAKAFGIAGQSGYDMSAAITGLTGDVASFYNLSQDEAYTKLKSIFTGETESLKDLGVVMTQTALDQYALNNGFGKTTAKMTEQEKVMLRYQFVMGQLSLAQGDFQRTSNGWANQVRVLKLQFDSLKATIGQGLINALTPVIKVINGIISRLQVAAEAFKSFTEALFGKSSGGSLGTVTGGAADNAGDINDNLGDAADNAKKIEKALLSFDEINKMPNKDKDSTSSLNPDYSGLEGSVLNDVNKELDNINKNAEKAAKTLKNFLKGVKEAAEPTTKALKKLWNEGLAKLSTFTWDTIKSFWNDFLKPMGKWILGERGLPRFFNITNDLLNKIDWKKLNKSLSDFFKELQKPAKFVWTALMDFYENFLAPLAVWTMSEGLPRFVDITKDMIKNIDWKKLNEALKNLWKAFEPFAEGVGEGLLEFYEVLSTIGTLVMNGIAEALSALGDALGKIDPLTLKELGKDLGLIAGTLLTMKALTGIMSKLKVFLVTISGLSFTGLTSLNLAGIISGLTSFGTMNLTGPAFQKIGNDILDAISDIIKKSIPDWASNLLGNLGTGIALGAAGGSWFPGGQIVGAILGGITGAFETMVPGSFESLMNGVFNLDMAKNLFDQMVENFKKAFSGNGGFIEIGANIIEGILNGLGAALALIVEPIGDVFVYFWDELCKAFGIHSPSKKMEPIGGNIILGIIEGLKKAITFAFKPIGDFFKYVYDSFCTVFDSHSPAKKMEPIGNNIIQGIIKGIKSAIEFVFEPIKSVFKYIYDSFCSVFDINSPAKKMEPIGNNIILGIIDGLKNKFGEFTNVIKDIPNKIKEGVGDLWDLGKELIGNFINGFKSMTIPMPHFDISWNEHEVAGLNFSTPSFSVQWYARGGFPSNGEMFVANEAGPEMVGKMGNRNVVANNNQITQGIKAAVIDGMMEVATVMGGNSPRGESPTIEFTFVIDSETLYKTVRKGQEKYKNRYESVATI